AIEEFVARHRGYRYAQEREQLRQHWEALENPLTAAYLQCQTKTSNWTKRQCYLGEVSDECNCRGQHFYTRKVDLIGSMGRYVSAPVRFCPCLPEAVQLVHQGYLPASPKEPRTAFAIPFLQAYQYQWNTSVTPASSFIEGHIRFLDSREQREHSSRGPGEHREGNRRNLTQPFSSATHLHSRI
ncbi:hypothetical protein DFH28DRAFT_876140, partial [Melampsora americana]